MTRKTAIIRNSAIGTSAVRTALEAAVLVVTASIMLLLTGVMLTAAFARDASQVREFRKLNPCPATQQANGPCPGFVVDHIIPLCLGGPDAPHNMQWQTIEDAKAKDREEHRQCREARR